MTSLIQNAVQAVWFTEWTLCVYKYPLLVFGLDVDFTVSLNSRYKRTQLQDDKGLEEIAIRLVVTFPNDIIQLAEDKVIGMSVHEGFICTKDIFETSMPAHIALGIALNTFVKQVTNKLSDRADQIASLVVEVDEITKEPTERDMN